MQGGITFARLGAERAGIRSVGQHRITDGETAAVVTLNVCPHAGLNTLGDEILKHLHADTRGYLVECPQ